MQRNIKLTERYLGTLKCTRSFPKKHLTRFDIKLSFFTFVMYHSISDYTITQFFLSREIKKISWNTLLVIRYWLEKITYIIQSIFLNRLGFQPAQRSMSALVRNALLGGRERSSKARRLTFEPKRSTLSAAQRSHSHHKTGP